MPEILIVYASTHGHTGKIAARIAAVLEPAGWRVDLREVTAAAECDPGAYDAAIVGGSIHAGRHQRELVEWARRHARRLNGVPSGFFSVCLAVADGSAESVAHARAWIDDFEDDTGWTPRRVASLAGALQYREYDPVTRLTMRLLMARGGHPTNVREDVEYTDWEAVDAFARDVAALVRAPVAA